jgi:hypothetical protein
MSPVRKLLYSSLVAAVAAVAAVTAATAVVGAAPAQAEPADTTPAVNSSQVSPALQAMSIQALQLIRIRGAQHTPGTGVHGMSSRTATWKHGSFLLWTSDSIYFNYNGSSVTSSSAWQNCGTVGLDTCTARGVQRVYASSWYHEYRFHWTVGIGVPTPWGAVNAYRYDQTEAGRVYGNGGSQFWSA